MSSKKSHFEILGQIAKENGNIRMSTNLVKADKKGENGYITMGVEGLSIQEMATEPDKYITMLIMVDKNRYFELSEEVADENNPG